MKKILSNTLLTISYPIRLLKKTRVDNFVGGLIFGALFSLVVNVTTVKIQEDINRQRALEALEREIVSHWVTANMIIGELNYLDNPKRDFTYYSSSASTKYNTKIFESDNVIPYLFQIDPTVYGKIYAYYDTIVNSANNSIKMNEEIYNNKAKKCRVEYGIITGDSDESIDYCIETAKNFLSVNTFLTTTIDEQIKDIRLGFHPTQDRLNSWWLKLLMGDKTTEIMKITENEK